MSAPHDEDDAGDDRRHHADEAGPGEHQPSRPAQRTRPTEPIRPAVGHAFSEGNGSETERENGRETGPEQQPADKDAAHGRKIDPVRHPGPSDAAELPDATEPLAVTWPPEVIERSRVT